MASQAALLPPEPGDANLPTNPPAAERRRDRPRGEDGTWRIAALLTAHAHVHALRRVCPGPGAYGRGPSPRVWGAGWECVFLSSSPGCCFETHIGGQDAAPSNDGRTEHLVPRALCIQRKPCMGLGAHPFPCSRPLSPPPRLSTCWSLLLSCYTGRGGSSVPPRARSGMGLRVTGSVHRMKEGGGSPGNQRLPRAPQAARPPGPAPQARPPAPPAQFLPSHQHLRPRPSRPANASGPVPPIPPAPPAQSLPSHQRLWPSPSRPTSTSSPVPPGLWHPEPRRARHRPSVTAAGCLRGLSLGQPPANPRSGCGLRRLSFSSSSV